MRLVYLRGSDEQHSLNYLLESFHVYIADCAYKGLVHWQRGLPKWVMSQVWVMAKIWMRFGTCQSCLIYQRAMSLKACALAAWSAQMFHFTPMGYGTVSHVIYMHKTRHKGHGHGLRSLHERVMSHMCLTAQIWMNHVTRVSCNTDMNKPRHTCESCHRCERVMSQKACALSARWARMSQVAWVIRHMCNTHMCNESCNESYV